MTSLASAVDNDVLVKLARYGLLDTDILSPALPPRVGVLSSARYVAGDSLKRACPAPNLEAALRCLETFLDASASLEPSPAEVALALELEDEAQRQGFALDTGESQLVAITVTRHLAVFATGDKRALAAIAGLAKGIPALRVLQGRLLCLEQLMLHLLETLDVALVRQAVCAAREADRAVAVCFQCNTDAVTLADVVEGLSSYVDDLARDCSGLLTATWRN